MIRRNGEIRCSKLFLFPSKTNPFRELGLLFFGEMIQRKSGNPSEETSIKIIKIEVSYSYNTVILN